VSSVLKSIVFIAEEEGTKHL